MNTETFRYEDLDLHTGRSLRVGVTLDANGEAQRLVIVPVWKDGGADRRHRVDVAAEVLPGLRNALDRLMEAGE